MGTTPKTGITGGANDILFEKGGALVLLFVCLVTGQGAEFEEVYLWIFWQLPTVGNYG